MIQARVESDLPACYVDSSAYVEFLTGGEQASRVAGWLTGRSWKSSAVLALETYRSLVRLARENHITTAQFHDCIDTLERDIHEFELQDGTLEICRGHVVPVSTLPRSLDLLHLRTALWFHQRQPLAKFVTLDEQQRKAAKELGLPV